MLLLRYPSIVDAAWVNCPKDAARHLTDPFLPGTPIARIESWQEHNRDCSEEFGLEEFSVNRHLGRGREPRAIVRRGKFTARDGGVPACHG